MIARGNLRQRSYQDKDGTTRTSYELDVDEIGPSLRYATAQVTRAQRADGGSHAPGGDGMGDWSSPPANEPQNGFGEPGQFGGFGEEGPF